MEDQTSLTPGDDLSAGDRAIEADLAALRPAAPPFTAAGIAASAEAARLRRRLWAWRGVPAAEVEAMPVAQAVGRYCIDTFESASDAVWKWYLLPYAQAAPRTVAHEQALHAYGRRDLAGMLGMLLPVGGRPRWSLARLDRRAAALQAVEALRAHAATHAGQLPESLDAVTDTPVPHDPTTAKPFGYQRTPTGFTLTSPVPPGGQPRDALRIDVTLEK